MLLQQLTGALSVAGRLVLFAVGVVAMLVIAVTLALADVIATLRSRFGHTATVPHSFPPLTSPAASVVILNWNGQHLLERGLPSVLTATGDDDEVIVVDNGSTDDSVSFVRTMFPTVRLVELPENVFFSAGNNAGIMAAHNDIIVLLNNDMIVDPHFLPPLVQTLMQTNVFAATAQIFLQDPTRPRHETGLTSAELRRGMLHLAHRTPNSAGKQGPEPVLWAGGGSTAYDARKLRALGGLDELYAPAYVEDVALSYAAWKRGWLSVFVSGSHVYHEHRGTSRRLFGDAYVDRLISRNRLLFIWRHFDWPLLARHLAWLPAHVAWLATQHTVRDALAILLSALSRLPDVALGRLAEVSPRVLSDEQILEQTDSVSASEPFNASDRRPSAVRLGTGWHARLDADESFRWMGRRAHTFVDLTRVPSEVHVRGYVPDFLLTGHEYVRLRLSMTGDEACVREFKASGTFVASLPVSSGPLGWRHLVLELNRTYNPGQRGHSRDGRELGIQVYAIELVD